MALIVFNRRRKRPPSCKGCWARHKQAGKAAAATSRAEPATKPFHRQGQRKPTADTILNAGIEYGKNGIMTGARKITIEVPAELLAKAQQASGAGITETIRTGLELVAASRTYARLRRLRGRVRFSRPWRQLKADR